MRTFFLLGVLVLATAIAQAAVIGPLLPSWLYLELGLLLGLASVAFLPAETALFFIFAMGLQADLQGSMRVGALAFCYVLSAGALLEVRRGLARSGPFAIWMAVVVGSALTHTAYLVLGRFLGGLLGIGNGFQEVGYRVLSAAIFAIPCIWFVKKWLTWWSLLDPESKRWREPVQRQRPLLRFRGS